MTSFLLLTAIVIFACVFLNRVSDKLGHPVLLAFILLGMFFGSDGPINILLKLQLCRRDLLDRTHFHHVLWGLRDELVHGKACRCPCDRAFRVRASS